MEAGYIATPVVIRSGFDIDGIKVELLWDETRNRFTVATRWVNLAHFEVEFTTQKWTRISLERAAAVFEAVCLNGATKEVARTAKKAAASFDSIFAANAAGYEREVLRRTDAALAAAGA